VVVIRVDYDTPPAGGSLIKDFNMKETAPIINNRTDTIHYFPITNTTYGQYDVPPNKYYFFRDRSNGLTIDNQYAKLYSLIQDGYGGDDIGTYGNYSRAEIQPAKFTLDSNKTYVFEWKGYFPQSYNYLVDWHYILTIFQIHGYKQVANPFGFYLNGDGNITATDVIDGNQFVQNIPITSLSELYNSTHTLRVTYREGKGYQNQSAFLKIEFDGKEKYLRKTGTVGSVGAGSTSGSDSDYVKFGGLYDFGRNIVSPDQLSRGRKYSLVTESFKAYVLGNNQIPTANAGTDQTITLPTNTVTISGSGKDADGTISSYQWTKISGPTGGTIKDANSPNTDVTDLVEGVYQFELKVTDNQGATGKSTMQITVNAAVNSSPTADAGTDQTIVLPTNSVTLSGSGKDSDGTISSYEWSKISGPSSGSIDNQNSANTTVSNLVEGVYQFELKVNDNNSAIGKGYCRDKCKCCK
jgi:hypothetical protein